MSVKKGAILLSGASGSGKTHLLGCLAGRSEMSDCRLLETDRLEYWRRSEPVREPVTSAFRRWYHEAVAEPGELARELEQNVLDHDDQTLLIKWHFLRSARQCPRFVVVNPQVMRWGNHARRFYQLASLLFDLELFHVALLPSPLRYAMNLSKRAKVPLPYPGEWVHIYRHRRSFDLVLRYGVRGLGARECDAIVRLMWEGAGGARSVPPCPATCEPGR